LPVTHVKDIPLTSLALAWAYCLDAQLSYHKSRVTVDVLSD